MILIYQLILLILSCLLQVDGCYYGKLFPQYQYKNFNLKKEIIQSDGKECLLFGFFTKYHPLSDTLQVGEVGILQSNCFHIFSIIDNLNNKINFLSYDCIDYEKQQIEKFYTFIGDDGNIYKHSYQLNIWEYESYWYILVVIADLVEKKVVIGFFKNHQEQDRQEYNTQYPYYDTDISYIYGGGLQIDVNQTLFNPLISKLSYFPGQYYYYKFCHIGSFQFFSFQQFAESIPITCQCKLNQDLNIPDQIIEKLIQEYYISENINCDSFNFQTWIRITEIYYYQKEIYYQLIKLSANLNDPRLLDDNLSAFQLFYKLTKSQNQIIITTYSYTFPIVNIDFSNNPFLIKKIFDIDCNIKLWHFIRVKKSKNSIQATINFYEGRKIIEYSFESTVIHFNLIKFKIGRGNILQTIPYLTIQFINMVFVNCEMDIKSDPCHYSCLQCDGPTKFDCLSCDPSANRIYNEKQKSCDCIYGKKEIDEKCKDYLYFNLTISQVDKKEFQCSYGYFEFEDQCWKCPSKIREKLISCIECIKNPKTWINNPYCQYDFVTDDNERPFSKLDNGIQQCFFDGSDIKMTQNLQNHQDIYSDYLQTNIRFQDFCQNCLLKVVVSKFYCFIFENCLLCEIQISKPICTKCEMNFLLKDGVCKIKQLIQTASSLQCETPYYETYYKDCIQCPIENCLYCFDYKKDDVQQNTIFTQFLTDKFYANDEQILVGCAQCIQGYIYDFTIGQCVLQKPQIKNCLRSFIDQEGKEQCILSSIDDFTVAPQINNCQNHILNCNQCFQNFQTIIKCHICDQGYRPSDLTGYCDFIGNISFTKYVVRFYDINVWRYIVQSFTMLFTKINYSYQQFQLYLFPIECLDGYQLNKGKCKVYCDKNCQKCQKDEISEGFTCALCSFNNYSQPYRVQENGKCIICPSLCLVCDIRTNDSIMNLNPNYIINGTNTIYTTQCIKSISNQNVDIDPNLLIARYIFDPISTAFEYKLILTCQIYQMIFEQNNIAFFERKFDFVYFNEIGLQQFILIINFDLSCTIKSKKYTIINYFQTKVFSIQLIKLKLHGDLPLFNQLQIYNFNYVEISNLLVNLSDNLIFDFQNNQKGLDYQIINSTFFSNNLKSIKFEIPMNVSNNCDIHNVSIMKAYIDNSIIFSINSITQNENILINYFFLRDCIFSNSILFNFNTSSQNIIIENLFIDRCELTNFILINFQQQTGYKIIIRSIIIKNSIFTNSSFLSSDNINLLFIYSIQIIDNQFLNSHFIKFSKILFSSNFVLKQNSFIESILFEKQSSLYYKDDITLNDIDISSNVFQNFQFLVINQNKITSTKIELTNLIFQDNTNLQKEIQDYLFKLSSCNILIQNLSIINTFNHRYFYLFNNSHINIRNVSVQNLLQEYKIPLKQDCAINNYQHSQLLFVNGFQSLYLGLIKFTNQITIDQSLIEIKSNDPIVSEETETIILENITFTGNILMKINQGNIFSIISIYSDKLQFIHFENIFYQENSYYQYIVDPTFASASLLFINSMYSSIFLQNIQCFENSLTNSFNSFITISSSQVKIVQIKVFHHNYLSIEFWNKYYAIQLQSNLNQIEVNYMIEQVLSIKNKGGVIQLIAEKFILENGEFKYLIAKSSSLLDIITKGSGIVILNNCSIAYSQNNLLSNQEQVGSININSQYSFLNLKLQNFNFSDVYNKLAPAIISLQPSEVSNYIIIKNIHVSNCFSLINLFSAIQFPYEIADQNQVIMENLIFQQSQQASIQFTRFLNILEPLTVSKIIQDNAIFNIQGCLLKIRNFKFEGFALSGIFKIINCKKIQLLNILFDQITIFYNLNLLNIEQISQFHSKIQIQSLTINNIRIFNSNIQKLTPYLYPNFFIDYQNCQTVRVVELQKNEQQLETKSNNFEQIQLSSTQNGSILYMKSQNNQTEVHLQSIILQYNDCNICKNGLIYFQLIDFLKIKIQELSCIGNIVQQLGCISALSDKKPKGIINIKNSLFINNTGSSGMALSSINVKTFLFNIKILNNRASLLGGGLYFDLDNKDFSINSTQIYHNQAREGGGIYLNRESILSKMNFENSLLNFNKAELSTNNLQELPSHLDLSINYQIMPSDQAFDQGSQKSLKLRPYQIIQQGKLIMANKLMIPSNQELTKYELYNRNSKKFTSYIKEISIQFKNRFNEQLLNYINSTCQIIQLIFDRKQQTKLESSNLSLIQYNQTTNNFDLGLLIFNFDPYNQTDKQYEIQIYCKTKNQIQELSYNIQVKSLVCQQGEFYILNGCLTCQPKQGFYSVTHNTTKCSIFDKTKFEAITSNNINLKPGFWRPHSESDLVSDCFKNVESCIGGWVVGNDICKVGHIGGLCEECDKHNFRGDGYYFKNDQYICLNCSDFSINILSLIFLTIWVFISTFITLTSVEKTNQLFTLFKLTQKFTYILFKLNQNQESIQLKLFLNYIWIFSVIFTFNIQFSFSFFFVSQISDTSYFLTRNLDCQLSQSFEIELIYLRVLVILTLITIQIFIIQLAYNIFSMLAKVKFRNNIISISLIYLYIQNYASLITQLFSILATREISQIDYVQGDVSLLFQSSSHQTWMYQFALPVSLLIGLVFPISLLWFMYKNRKSFDKIKFRRHIGYLFNEYNINCSFWEWVKLWKKTIIIVILIYFETNIFLKGILIGMCLMIYQIITSTFLPYIYQKLNRLDLSSGQFCLIAIFLAAVQYLCEQQKNMEQARILQILIILISFKFSFPYIYDILLAFYEKYKQTILIFCLLILNKLMANSILVKKLNDKLVQWRQKSSRINKNFKKLRQLTITAKSKDKKSNNQFLFLTNPFIKEQKQNSSF